MKGMHAKIKQQLCVKAPQKQVVVATNNTPIVLEEPEQKEQRKLEPTPIQVVETRPSSAGEVVDSNVEVVNKEAPNEDINEVEEFLDREKERLYTEAENWRKTAQDLDMDLKSALKSNEKFIKENLGVKEDYQKVSEVAGELQGKVHNLQEEVKEIKLKIELDIKAKDKAEI